MEKYLNNQSQSKSIADSFTLPNTITNYDKDTLLATIIRRYSTLPTLYDDPDWFYEECSLWWDENKIAFTKMWEAIEKEYNIIENYNRVETKEGTITDAGNKSSETSGETVVDGETNASGTVTNSLSGTGSVVTDQDTSGEAENKVSAFNESTYQPNSKTEESGTLDSTVTTSQSDTNTETRDTKDEVDTTTTTSGTFSEEHSNTSEEKYKLHISGNIGLTTSQQMLESEVLFRKKYNLYKIMANTFADDMCLGIW